MFDRLMQRWNVSKGRFVLILATFALGGSCCGMAGRKLLDLAGLDRGWLWIVVYIILVTVLWPACVLLVSIPLGQFPFFKSYIKKILGRMTGKKSYSALPRLAIFASGAGSNAENLIHHFNKNATARIVLIVCNNPQAGVRQIAANHGIELLMIDRSSLNDPGSCLARLKDRKVDFIILAGFLWKIPSVLVEAYPGKIVNIHPALLPKYGGKGMYGHHVHNAVITARETESGITIHLANEVYDNGKILFQASCPIEATDTATSLAKKIHELEHRHFPVVVEAFIKAKS